LKAALVRKPTQTLTRQQLQARLVWASLIKLVYEVDRAMSRLRKHREDTGPDRCDRQSDVDKILRHCYLWREPKQLAPPDSPVADSQPREMTYDPGFFGREVA
jgi:hypothetical protein